MKRLILDAVPLFAVMLWHIYNAPFSKVEESFNMQATHDLLFKPWTNLSIFDHMYFPGVVPRTFIGPLILSVLSLPFKHLLSLPPYSCLYLIRAILGSLTVLSLLSIRSALNSTYTPLTGTLFTFLTSVQFHLMYYASRTLPNIFALVLSNLSLADRITSSSSLSSSSSFTLYRSIILLSIACALFRSELCLYIFFILLLDFFTRRLQPLKTIALGLLTAISTAALSMILDSYFWQRWSYPELEVFHFNVVLNKSSAWGTLPFHWYFTNALPKALGGAYILAIWQLLIGFQESSMWQIPAVLFVAVYSILPHKELRFIFYALPVFNGAAARAAERILRELRAGMESGLQKKTDGVYEEKNAQQWGVLRRLKCVLMCAFVLFAFLTSALHTVIASVASAGNYPAGYAMLKMHALERRFYSENGLCGSNVNDGVVASVHIDVDSAMNGVSQFLYESGEGCPKWKYSKREDVRKIDWNEYTHLLTVNKTVEGFEKVHVEKVFAGIAWREMKMKWEPHTFVMRRKGLRSSGTETVAR